MGQQGTAELVRLVAMLVWDREILDLMLNGLIKP